jgi:hypothetical protein
MMMIQQVIVMSNQPPVQSGQAGVPPNEAEYNAVYTAVTATERGRWFLAEYANRNRSADTERVIAAIARIETAIATGTVPQLSTIVSRDLAVAPRPVAPIPAAPLPIAPVRSGGGERDDDAATSVRPMSVSGMSVSGLSVSGIAKAETKTEVLEAKLEARLEAKLETPNADQTTQKDRDYSDAVAAIAASLAARVGEFEARVTKDLPVDVPREPERQYDIMDGAPSEAVTPRLRVPQDNAPLWHIDAPDFVFGKSGREDVRGAVEPIGETALAQSQLLGAAILSANNDEVAAAFEGPPDAVMEAAIEEAAIKAVVEPARGVEPPRPSPSPPAEIVPLVEISRPQLRIANDPAPPAPQQQRRYDSLTGTDALSEDEVIALFG